MTMSTTDWLVIVAGLAAIGWVNWYFFVASRRVGAVAVAPTSGAPEVHITVRGGYDPATIRARAGEPVTLVFDRQETSGCSEEVVFADFGVRRYLPAHQRTAVELTAPAPGSYEFTCGMGMLRGRLVAE
jgi:plastocyanin domain-containing protein